MRLSRSLDLIFETHSPARLIPAIAWNGKVYQADPGSTSHFDALNKVPIDQRQAATLDGDNRVFVNERGRVMNRRRAMAYALANDLIRPDAPSYARTSDELIGEWLRSNDTMNESVLPRVFYRGINSGDTRRIRTGDTDWDRRLFVSSDRDSALMYGKVISVFTARPEAKILYEGTQPFRRIAKGLFRQGTRMLPSCSEVVRRAESAGYDAVWFRMQGDIGTVVINPNAFDVRSEMNESSTVVDGTRVWKNPSLAQINAIINRAGWDEGKALLSGNDLYVWDGRREHHMDIIRKLGLPQSNAFNRTGKLYLFRDENGRIGLHFNKPDEHDDPMSDRGLWKKFGTGKLEHPMVQRLVRQGIHVPEYARQTVIHESVKLDTFVANWRGGTGRYDTRFYRKIHNGETLDDENGKAIAVKDRLEPIRAIVSWIPAQKRSGVIFRGMSAQEYANVLRTGEIRSNGSYNIGDQQVGLTYYSTEPDSAASYATSFAPSQHAPTFDQPAYVVGVHMPDQNRIRYVKGTGEHEVGVIGPIPVLDIIEVYRAIVIEQGTESYMTRVHWEKIR